MLFGLSSECPAFVNFVGSCSLVPFRQLSRSSPLVVRIPRRVGKSLVSLSSYGRLPVNSLIATLGINHPEPKIRNLKPQSVVT